MSDVVGALLVLIIVFGLGCFGFGVFIMSLMGA